MSTKLAPNVELAAVMETEEQQLLTSGCLDFIKKLHENFDSRRRELLTRRQERLRALDSGAEKVDFLSETKQIRESEWTIDPLPKALQQRRVEITGPVDRKMVINAMNSGADCYMADFEDSTSPTWRAQINGQLNLRDAIRRQIDFNDGNKDYKLNDQTATLLVRPRGWHLDEKHIRINGKRMSGSLFDFGVFAFHNAQKLVSLGYGPYFYLPKLESHLEARLWNEVFNLSEAELGLQRGTIKATVLVENILAAFEMDEILYELREHSAGLNAGRWDYIFSCIKMFKGNKDLVFADRSLLTMTVPFMRAYNLSLIKTCHRRRAPAIGGMSALIPIKDDPAANEKAMAGVREDKARDARDGCDGGWVAHPGLVGMAREEMDKVLQGKPNQIDKQLNDYQIKAQDLIDFRPNSPITEKGLRHNTSVAIQYLGSWLSGKGCVPIFNLMEDAATAEISRSQVWQWVHSPKGILEDGRKVTPELVRSIIKEELGKIKASNKAPFAFDKAAEIFAQMSTSEKFEDFLTLPLYEQI